jgi:hypothetical protein
MKSDGLVLTAKTIRSQVKRQVKRSSEKSKTLVGIRTEIDHVNKIVTQDQMQLIP